MLSNPMYSEKTGRAQGPATGALMRLWRETHSPKSADGTAAPEIIELTKIDAAPTQRHSYKVPLQAIYGPSTDGNLLVPDMETIHCMPAIHLSMHETEKTPAQKPIPYIHYQSRDANPLTMLFGAVVMCVEQLGHVPGMLFISRLTEPILDIQTARVTGKPYDRRLHICTSASMDGKIRAIPIYTEEWLPDVIAARLRPTTYQGNLISRESVIALCEV